MCRNGFFLHTLISIHFSFFYSARSVPLSYTSCTMTLSDGIPYRYDGLFYRKNGITEALYHSGCTVYAPLRQRPPGYGVSSSRFHMVRIRTHRTSCNRQVNLITASTMLLMLNSAPMWIFEQAILVSSVSTSISPLPSTS